MADIFHWMKQIIAITLGILFGLCGVTGWIGFVSLFIVIFTTSNLYVQTAQIPDDVVGGPEAFQEGLMPAVMTFTVSCLL